jgi:hypothetical protein
MGRCQRHYQPRRRRHGALVKRRIDDLGLAELDNLFRDWPTTSGAGSERSVADAYRLPRSAARRYVRRRTEEQLLVAPDDDGDDGDVDLDASAQSFGTPVRRGARAKLTPSEDEALAGELHSAQAGWSHCLSAMGRGHSNSRFLTFRRSNIDAGSLRSLVHCSQRCTPSRAVQPIHWLRSRVPRNVPATRWTSTRGHCACSATAEAYQRGSCAGVAATEEEAKNKAVKQLHGKILTADAALAVMRQAELDALTAAESKLNAQKARGTRAINKQVEFELSKRKRDDQLAVE